MSHPVLSTALVSLATPDLGRMDRFYRQLLGPWLAVEVPETYIEFRPPGLRLGLYRSSNPDYTACLGAISICLQVESLEAILALPILDSVSISPLREAFHGREVDFCDPDGNRIVVHEPSPAFWQLMGLSPSSSAEIGYSQN